MNASELTEWIGLFAPNLQPDGAGGFVETIPANVAEDRPAAYVYVSGRRTLNDGQNADRAEYHFTIRYEPGITTALRVSWRSMYLDLLNVENLEAEDTWLRLSAVKREAGTQ